MELTKREHVVLGIRGMILESLFAEGLKGCDSRTFPEPVALSPPYTRFSFDEILQQKQILPGESLCVDYRLNRHYLLEFTHEYKDSPESFQNTLLELISLRHPACFEVIGNQQRIHLQISASEEDASLVFNSFGKLNSVVLVPVSDRLDKDAYHFIDVYPLPPYFRSMTALSVVPFIENVVSALGMSEDTAVLQVIFEPLSDDWRANLSACLDLEKKVQMLKVHPAFEYARLTKEQYKSTGVKASSPLFAVALRIASTDEGRLKDLSALLNMFHYGGYPLQVVPSSAYPNRENVIADRLTYRHGMVLSVEELHHLAGLPSAETVKACNLYHHGTNDHDDTILLGYSNDSPVVQSSQSRVRHTVVVGRTGKGKSTLLQRMIAQDIEAGRGIGVIDPHGDLVADVLRFIPSGRIKDVVYLSPAEEDHTMGFNPFEALDNNNRGKLADDLVYCFKNAFTSWGERMEAIFRQCFFALYTLPNASLADLRGLLSKDDGTLRNQVLQLLDNEEAERFWNEDFHQYTRSAFDPILNKMGKFLLNEYLGRLFQQRRNLIDLTEVMNTEKILLISIPSGLVGKAGANLLGGIFLSSLYHASLSRASIPPAQRKPFFLYVDEFQRFSTKSTEDILREARKYNLGLIVAFQQFGNLRSGINIALENADSVIAFDLGLDDSRRLVKQFHGLELKDLQQKGVGKTWAILNNQLHNFQTLPPDGSDRGNGQETVRYSLSRYYTEVQSEPRGEVLDLPYDEI